VALALAVTALAAVGTTAAGQRLQRSQRTAMANVPSAHHMIFAINKDGSHGFPGRADALAGRLVKGQ